MDDEILDVPAGYLQNAARRKLSAGGESHRGRDRRIKWYYETTARAYDWLIARVAAIQGVDPLAARAALARFAQPRPGSLILEVGCGTGSNLPILAEIAGPTGLVVGLDLAAHMLYQAKNKTRQAKACLVQGLDLRLPFPDGRFQLVYQFGVLRAVSDPRRMLQEIQRVTCPGGQIVVAEKCLYRVQRRSLWARLIAALNPSMALPPNPGLMREIIGVPEIQWFWGDQVYAMRATNRTWHR